MALERRDVHWSHGLILELSKPQNWIAESENAVVIRDRYPKAMYHFLVVSKADILNIFELTRDDLPLLNEMFELALNLIFSKDRRLEEFKIGYHAEPSLLQLHMHVISTDFHSPTMKTERHWNSFNTQLFIPHEELMRRLMDYGRISKMDPRLIDELRMTQLKCNRCDRTEESIIHFKEHLKCHLIPFGKMAGWSLGLLNSLKDKSQWIISNTDAIVISDKFPKAKFHFLVLPRENISNIFQLTTDHLQLLNEMYLLAKNIIEIKGGEDDEFKIGYHAEPSMQQVHLHVISTDFNSPALKTKKHWNSFTTEFFVPHEELMRRLKADGKVAKLSSTTAKELLATPLKCHRCHATPKTMPDLKSHLLQHLK
ncbi:aprataxin-like protein [Contarinia nasturtii]|uniref:aprataxin-like protein n=1 Tax=Contarinia nasturtii TaxID=265458 RepID=UPI0012D37E81|nr:aprataxin-like protein [Contarinia nasturtii]